jgi:hypothetical protein
MPGVSDEIMAGPQAQRATCNGARRPDVSAISAETSGRRKTTMQVTKTIEVPPRLKVLATLAMLLERLEHNAGPVSADQYRSVVQHLDRELQALETDDALEALLQFFPAMAQVYENARYDQAGLCRSPLDSSLSTELAAKAAIALASRGARS